MGIFRVSYTLHVPMEKTKAQQLFSDIFQDMSKKGYSMTTIVMNSDYGKAKFTGMQQDNCFTVRQTEDTSDTIYYYIPKQKIEFRYAADGGTDIVVNGSFSLMRIVFFILLFAALSMAATLIMDEISYPANLILGAAAAAIGIGTVGICAYSKSEFRKTKETLEDLYQIKS